MNKLARMALGLEYDGSDFHGWQRQPNLRTVQGCLEKALSKIADAPITTVCAGRTDAGVHASAQVIHFDTEAQRTDTAWVLGVNARLPKEVSVAWAKMVPVDFSARFSAVARQYRYLICNRPHHPAIQRQFMAWEPHPLDVGHMQAASEYLIGAHDFSSFRAAECQAKTSQRHVKSLHIQQQGSIIQIDIKANAFLHHMVRNIVGVLIVIGQGKQDPLWAQQVLHARDRKAAAATASAKGLCLVNVGYPPEFGLPNLG